LGGVYWWHLCFIIWCIASVLRGDESGGGWLHYMVDTWFLN
jgi:hypothetical protein